MRVGKAKTARREMKERIDPLHPPPAHKPTTRTVQYVLYLEAPPSHHIHMHIQYMAVTLLAISRIVRCT